VSALATSLLFVRAHGEVETIDAGFIAGSAASVQADGSVLVVYGWLATATATTGEIRVRELGSAEAPKIVPVEPPATVRGMDGSDALIGYLTEVGAQQSRLDLDTGTLESLAEPGTVAVEGVTAGGLVVTWDNDSQCLAARGPDGENAWERCDGTFSYGLSPDRRWIAAPEGGLDAETGEQVSTFAGLPQRGELVQFPYLMAPFVGWETDETVIFRVTLIEHEAESTTSAQGHVAVRCSVTTGACDRIPHPADLVPDLIQ
jgi:hypothetical protein